MRPADIQVAALPTLVYESLVKYVAAVNTLPETRHSDVARENVRKHAQDVADYLVFAAGGTFDENTNIMTLEPIAGGAS